jgi:hypothetical protein
MLFMATKDPGAANKISRTAIGLARVAATIIIVQSQFIFTLRYIIADQIHLPAMISNCHLVDMVIRPHCVELPGAKRVFVAVHQKTSSCSHQCLSDIFSQILRQRRTQSSGTFSSWAATHRVQVRLCRRTPPPTLLVVHSALFSSLGQKTSYLLSPNEMTHILRSWIAPQLLPMRDKSLA